MLRRLIVAGCAAALAAPAYIVTPASAAVLFSCDVMLSSSIFNLRDGAIGGLGHSRTAQNVNGAIDSDCNNGERVSIFPSEMTSFTPRPFGCPVMWGGAGPDHPDQTPILLGPNPSFEANWYVDLTDTGISYGIAKVKQGPTGAQWRLVFNITSGKYAPPAGKKTKIKGTVNIVPHPDQSTYTCADDTDPVVFLLPSLPSGESLIVNQK